MTKKEQEQVYDRENVFGDLLDEAYATIGRQSAEIRGKNKKLFHQRQQLRMFQEKVQLMKTWSGIFRTIGQRLGISN